MEHLLADRLIEIRRLLNTMACHGFRMDELAKSYVLQFGDGLYTLYEEELDSRPIRLCYEIRGKYIETLYQGFTVERAEISHPYAWRFKKREGG